MTAGDPYQVDRGFYQAADGRSEAHITNPISQGLPSFLDTLAKANTLDLSQTRAHMDLFEATQSLLNRFLECGSVPTPPLGGGQENLGEPRRGPGTGLLARVYGSFSIGETNVALYQLLDAYPKPKSTTGDPSAKQAKQDYANALNTFRAAFAADAETLAKQVAAKITAQKE